MSIVDYKFGRNLQQFIFAAVFYATIIAVMARYEDRYDQSMLPFDLRPVRAFVGLWRLNEVQGNHMDFPPPDQLDYAINPIPKFGARAINITHSYFDGGSSVNVYKSEYGFMPVKNATRKDPRVHVAYLTSGSEGWSMMEQGVLHDETIMSFHLKQYLRRSFDVGSTGRPFDMQTLEREIRLLNNGMLQMNVRAETGAGRETYTATYRKVI